MPTADPGIAWWIPLTALGVIAAASFLVSYLATDVWHVRHGPYIALLTATTALLTLGYLTLMDTMSTFAQAKWAWGLVGAVVAGAATAVMARKMPVVHRSHRLSLIGRLGWEGVVYGAAEAMLLSVLPVLAVWQSGQALGWTNASPGRLGVGALAIAASMVVIAVHHLGYREFRGPMLRYPVLICACYSLAYLLTGSVLAAIGAHIVFHAVAVVRGAELPPARLLPASAPREPAGAAATARDRQLAA
jgi:hypothetical protein